MNGKRAPKSSNSGTNNSNKQRSVSYSSSLPTNTTTTTITSSSSLSAPLSEPSSPEKRNILVSQHQQQQQPSNSKKTNRTVSYPGITYSTQQQKHQPSTVFHHPNQFASLLPSTSPPLQPTSPPILNQDLHTTAMTLNDPGNRRSKKRKNKKKKPSVHQQIRAVGQDDMDMDMELEGSDEAVRKPLLSENHYNEQQNDSEESTDEETGINFEETEEETEMEYPEETEEDEETDENYATESEMESDIQDLRGKQSRFENPVIATSANAKATSTATGASKKHITTSFASPVLLSSSPSSMVTPPTAVFPNNNFNNSTNTTTSTSSPTPNHVNNNVNFASTSNTSNNNNNNHIRRKSSAPQSPRSGSPIPGNGGSGATTSNESSALLVNQPAKKKWQNFLVRTLWTFIMVGGFLGLILAGHIYVILLVCFISTWVYKEVISIAHIPSKEKKLPWFRSLNWYFLFATNYFLYGESIIYYFKDSVYVDAFLLPLATHHRFISFSVYCFGFVLFVMNLKRGHYKFQFAQFGWTHMALLLVICQSIFIVNNILEGMFWFVIPVSLVICNDICAYICGFFLGRTPLIKLSPKKTWEGFLGAFLCTLVFGFFFSRWLVQSPYMICPVKDLGTSFWSYTNVSSPYPYYFPPTTGIPSTTSSTTIPTTNSVAAMCNPVNPVFIPQKYHLSPPLSSLFRHLFRLDSPLRFVYIAPVQWHVMIMACFASLFAPFGGFFASGVKRAFKIKDFGDSIPGHGGITDRMDCQFLMGLFSYMYYISFIKVYSEMSVGRVLEMAVGYLSVEEQLELFERLRAYLVGQGLVE